MRPEKGITGVPASMTGLATLIIASLALGPAAQAGVRYVQAGAPGPVHDGVSWTTAFASVQAAVDAAAADDEIWVAAGTYTENITVGKALALYGGFAGSETERTDRNPQAHVTALDGGGTGNVILFSVSSASGTSVLDGFTIRHPEPNTGIGVLALRPVAGPTLTIVGNRVTGCFTGIRAAAGTAILGNLLVNNQTGIVGTGAAQLANNVFFGNSVGLAGPPATLANNTFFSNGTGLDAAGVNVTVANNLFTSNDVGAANLGATSKAYANCVFSNETDYTGIPDPTGTNGNIRKDPKLAGPGVGEYHLQPGSPCMDTGNDTYVQSGWTDADGQPRVQGTQVDIGADETDGTAWTVSPLVIRVSRNGDDANDGSSWALTKRSIQAAVEALWGHGGEVWIAGGVYREPVSIYLGASLYGGFTGTENDRSERGGGASIIDGGAGDVAVSLSSVATPARLENLTIRNAITGVGFRSGSSTVANSLIYGNVDGVDAAGAAPSLVNDTIIANGTGLSVTSGTVAVTNTILAYNDLGVAAYLSGAVPVTFSHDCLFGNTTTASGIPDPTGSNGTIATDPRLAGAALGNVRLAPDSPCRDAGDAAAVTGDRDIYGQPRLLGVTADIGAAESDGSTPAVAPVVIRVSPAGDDEKDGLTWATAKRTIQAASDAAVGGEVWIAGGAYPETVRLNAFTSLYGGFSGAESNREDRDPVAHPVVVDGQGGDSALTLLGGFSFATIDGFGLTGADTGIDMTGASPTISHCTLTGTGVHGILATGGSPSIVANTIRDAGFAVYATDGAPDITGNTLIRNRQGIYLLNTSGSVSRNTVLDNTTVGVTLFEGGVSVRNNVLSGNGSAGLYAVGGSHAATGNTFLANGTAVNSASATLALTNSLVAFNYVGVQTTGASPVLFSHDCIYGNATDTAGIANPAGTNGNINVDPGLNGAALGDIHLAPDSPCRGTGDLTAAVPGEFDIDGEARTANGAVSIGADEPDGVLHTPSAVIIRVRPDGDDGRDGLSWSMAKRTLSSAAASAIGGEVWVAAGTYPGSVSVPPFVSMYSGFAGAEAAREGRNPAANPTIVDPAGSASGFRLNGGYRFTTLSGFTVRNARSGVFATTGLPVIASNTFTDCRLGLHLVSAAPIVVGNFLSVHAAQPASLISCEGAPALIANNLLTCDAAASDGVIGVDISGGAGPTLVNNTIARLATGVQLGSGTTSAALANNIIALNNRGLYSLASPRPVVTFRSNDIGANTVNVTGLIDPTGGSGNISGDPQFQDAPNGDFRLSVLSPGRDAGDDGSVLAGWPDVAGNPRITGDRVDMGAYEFNGLLLPDALAALKIAAGLQAATPTDLARLNIGASGDGAETVDLVDAAAVLRKATGLDR